MPKHMLKQAGTPSTRERLRRFETNAFCCCFVAFSAIAIDALCALPRGMEKQVPASLRCTSLCVVACLGSPIVATDTEEVQRSVLFILLVVVALAGEHHGQNYVRAADALFVLITGCVTVTVFCLQIRSVDKRPILGSSLSGALLAYIGLRAVRSGMTHGSEASNFRVEAFAFETNGYALGDGVVAVSVTFGGAMLACTGVLVMFNTTMIQEHGTFAISQAIAMNASFVFVSAFVAQLSVDTNIENLAVLFSSTSCSGDRDRCAAAYRARRFYVANSAPALLWAGCIAATVLSMPKQRRCATRIDYYETSGTNQASTTVAVAVTIIMAATIYNVAQVELFLLFLSIPLAWFSNTFAACTFAACTLNVAGTLLYIRRRRVWLDMLYYTHLSVAVTTALVVIIGLNTLIQRTLYVCERSILTCDGGKSECLAHVTGSLTVAVLSVQFALSLGTLALTSVYDGALTTTDVGWTTAGYEYMVLHLLTFFFAAAVYGSRYETGDVHGISVRLRRIMWYTTPCLIGAASAIVAMSRGLGPVHIDSDDVFGVSTAIVSAVVPWLVTGIGV